MNYDASATINAAIATINPGTAVPAFHTSRSGLKVGVGAVVYDNGKHCNQPAFPVKIDGTVDKHDAEQLAEFFSRLSQAMKRV